MQEQRETRRQARKRARRRAKRREALRAKAGTTIRHPGGAGRTIIIDGNIEGRKRHRRKWSVATISIISIISITAYATSQILSNPSDISITIESDESSGTTMKLTYVVAPSQDTDTTTNLDGTTITEGATDEGHRPNI